MSINSDFFFVSVKSIYPNFAKPSKLDVEIWEEVLDGYSVDDILLAIKSYRKNEELNVAPCPAKFRKYIFSRTPKEVSGGLPMSAELYLMDLDRKAGRPVYYFHDYTMGIKHVFEAKLKPILEQDEFNKLDYSDKYKLAVEHGLFADFDLVMAKIVEARAV